MCNSEEKNPHALAFTVGTVCLGISIFFLIAVCYDVTRLDILLICVSLCHCLLVTHVCRQKSLMLHGQTPATVIQSSWLYPHTVQDLHALLTPGLTYPNTTLTLRLSPNTHIGFLQIFVELVHLLPNRLHVLFCFIAIFPFPPKDRLYFPFPLFFFLPVWQQVLWSLNCFGFSMEIWELQALHSTTFLTQLLWFEVLLCLVCTTLYT